MHHINKNSDEMDDLQITFHTVVLSFPHLSVESLLLGFQSAWLAHSSSSLPPIYASEDIAIAVDSLFVKLT